MKTIYSYVELPYRVQQDIKEKDVCTDRYLDYITNAKYEKLKEILESMFIDFEVNYNNQITLPKRELYKALNIDLHPSIAKVQLLIYSREVNFIFKNDRYLTLQQLKEITKSAEETRTKLLEVINEIRKKLDAFEPSFEDSVKDNYYTEDGRLVNIE